MITHASSTETNGCCRTRLPKGDVMATRQLSLGRLALLLLLIAHFNALATSCPDGFDVHNGKCFRLYGDKATFSNAKASCEMAIVDSNSTNSFLANMMKENMVTDAWLGGSLKKTGWHWGEGGADLKYQGCFDTENSIHNAIIEDRRPYTPNTCIVFCRDFKSKYAGLTVLYSKISCICVSDFFEDKMYDGCHTPCVRDIKLTCGGNNYIQLYSVTGADIPDWKPQFPADNYTLNMCSMLRKHAGQYTLTDAKCALFNNTVGYLCEYVNNVDTCLDAAGKCFKIFASHSREITWYVARELCLNDGGRLLQIDTVEFSDYIMTSPPTLELPGVDSWWVGGSNVRWQWPNGRDILYTNWYSGSPNQTPKECLRLTDDSYWKDTDCNAAKPFFCQTDIGECISSPCLNGARCTDAEKSYTCGCVAGYTGTQCETDVNECISSPCLNGASCNDSMNSYTCDCVDGYTGTLCETDVNECISSPCMNGAICNDSMNSYTCDCVDGYTGTHCETVSTTDPPIRSRMFTHGNAANDKEIKCSKRFRLGRSRPLLFRHIKLFDFVTDRLVIYTHGYLSLCQRFLKRHPPENIMKAMGNGKAKHARRRGYGLLAPFWADSDCTKNSETYYHVYDSKTTAPNPADKTRTDAIMNLAKEYINNYSVDQDVNPDWVLVVTWVNNFPLLENDSTRNKPITFQLVLMSDGEKKKTYVIYLYDPTGSDNPVSVRPSFLGYYMTKNGKIYSKTIEVSNTSNPFRVADLQGNTGEKGIFFFPLSTTSAGHLSCLKWYKAELPKLANITKLMESTTTCPCDLPMLTKDSRWMIDWSRFVTKSGCHSVCFYDRQQLTQATQYCCYNPMGKLIQGNHTLASRLFLYRPALTEQHRVNDVVPKKWCCDQSNNCDKFHEVRPLRACVDSPM